MISTSQNYSGADFLFLIMKPWWCIFSNAKALGSACLWAKPKLRHWNNGFDFGEAYAFMENDAWKMGRAAPYARLEVLRFGWLWRIESTARICFSICSSFHIIDRLLTFRRCFLLQLHLCLFRSWEVLVFLSWRVVLFFFWRGDAISGGLVLPFIGSYGVSKSISWFWLDASLVKIILCLLLLRSANVVLNAFYLWEKLFAGANRQEWHGNFQGGTLLHFHHTVSL